MTLPDLAYFKARTAEEAFYLRAEHPQARYMAGGTDLLPQVRCGSCSPVFVGGVCTPPTAVIDVKTISGLSRIREHNDGSVGIGAAATVAMVAKHPLIRERYPVLTDCCLSLGSYPLRNRATVAGNIVNASPCADTAAALLALDAQVLAASLDGVRVLPLQEFFRGPGQTSLRPDELVTEIILPAGSRGSVGHYERIARRRAVDISTVAVLVVWLPGAEPQHRISLLSVAPTPLRVPGAEKLLDVKGPDAAAEAADLARSSCQAITDVRATAEYRQAMVGVLTERCVRVLSRDGR